MIQTKVVALRGRHPMTLKLS